MPKVKRLRRPALRELPLVAAAAVMVLVGVGAKVAGGQGPDAPARASSRFVDIQLLGVNDFHGHLERSEAEEKPGTGRRVGVGGAAYLGAHLDRAAREHPGHTIRVHAGDMVGASPLISSHFHDEPTVDAMNLMHFDVGTVGNHEFDEGGPEMLRLIGGGQRRDGLQYKRDELGRLVDTSRPGFGGARFPYISANAEARSSRRLLLPPYRIVERAGVKVGFIGVTTDTTPTFLLARLSRPLRFLDVSESVNRWVPVLRRKGVGTIVVLAHSGAFQQRGDAGRARGEIIDETRQMSDAVDVVIAGHTHSRLNTTVPNHHGGGHKLVVQALSYGTAYDRVMLRIDRGTGEVASKRAAVPRTWSDEVVPDRKLEALVSLYARRVAPLARRVLAVTREPLTRTAEAGRGGATGLGEVMADAERRSGRADFALVNPGSVRADLPAGEVTFEELFSVAPYEHPLMRLELTGSELRDALEEQWGRGRTMLQVSGLRYRYDPSRPAGRRVVGLERASGRPIRPQARYSVVANELIATGEAFPALRRAGHHGRVIGSDLDALSAHAKQLGRLAAPRGVRVARLP